MAKFKDYPCLYYVCANLGRSEQMQFFAALAAMFGLTPEEAANTSEFFAHTSSGSLFSGERFSAEELQGCGPYFDSPYKDCRSFYRKSAIKKIELKEHCCLICPYAAHYVNARIADERMVLKSTMEGNRDAFQNNLTTESFCSALPVSCTNEVGKLPVIKFHSILYEYLMQMDSPELDVENLFSFVYDSVSKQGFFVEPDVLRSFIKVQLRQIQEVPDYSSEMVSVALIRLYNAYKYVPEKLVFPASVPKKSTAKKRNETLNKQVFAAPSMELESLFSQEQSVTPTSITLEEQPVALNREVPPQTDDVTPESVSAEMIADPPVPEAENATPLSPTLIEDTDHVGHVPESSCEVSDCLGSTPSETETGAQSDVTEEMVAEYADSPVSTEIMPRKKHRRKRKHKNHHPEYYENRADYKTRKHLRAVLFKYHFDKYFKDVYRVSAPPMCLPEQCAACRFSTFHDTAICESSTMQYALHQHSAAWYAVADSDSNDLSDTMMSERLAFLTPKGKNFLQLKHSSGCAFEFGDEIRKDCIYSPALPVISDKFYPCIINCTANELSHLVDFISEACNCRHISVESGIYDNVPGLLFYVSGNFYFFNPFYDTVGFLKPLFSDASKVTFYSVNPIPVHACLRAIGINRLRIESVAAFYSAVIGVRVLLPAGKIFNLSRGLMPDFYARIMPQYEEVYRRSLKLVTYKTQTFYEKGLRLESALGHSKNLSRIARESSDCIQGGNFYRYRFLFSDLNQLTERGTLMNVSLRVSLKTPQRRPALLLQEFWEDVAGRVDASAHKFNEFAYLLSLSSEGVTYYCCYETSHFYDVLIDIVRAAYRDAIGGIPDVEVVCEQYV